MGESLEYPVKFPRNEHSENLSRKYGYKEWMISRFLNFIPDTEKLLEHIERNSRNYNVFIRTNTIKIQPKELKNRLRNKGYIVNDTILKEVFEIIKEDNKINQKARADDNLNGDLVSKTTTNDYHSNKKIEKNKIRSNILNETDNISSKRLSSIGSTIEYLKGYYYIQDLSSCIAVEELEIDNPQDLTVLDMAASPGGKTTHIAQKMKNQGTVIACESNIKRIPPLIFNLSRCFVQNTLVLNIQGEEIKKFGLKFDRILLDAPCTCEGIILKDLSRKTSRDLEDLDICSEKQKKMIHVAFESLKPNGLLIYCTCSFAPEENEMIVEHLLNKHKDAEIEPLRYGINGITKFSEYRFTNNMSNTKRLYPHIHNTNGFFIAKIRKTLE